MSAAHHTPTLSEAEARLPENSGWRKLMPIAAVIGLLGLGATFGLGQADGKTALYSYLTAYIFGLSIAVGAMFFVTIQFLTRAGWSVTVRRLMEFMMLPALVFIVLFVPIWLGMDTIYKWTDTTMLDASADNYDPLLVAKYGYLNTPFFLARAAFYLLAFAAIAILFFRMSVKQDGSGDPGITRRLQFLSAPAVMVLALVTTFAGLDWVMTLDFHWFSTIFGVYWFAGSFLVALAVCTLLALALRRSGLLASAINIEHYHDLGKLTFGFIVFWTYIAFSQYFLIWYANIPETTFWYGIRMDGGWMTFSWALIFMHFIIPFAFLMPRTIKRNTLTLGIGAAWVVLVHYMDMYFLIMPMHHHEGPAFSLTDITALIGVVGLFFAVVGWAMSRNALVPVKDPRLSESLSFQNF